MTEELLSPATIIAQELNVKLWQVEAAIALMDEGSTVPFIARYRKEATGGLNDIQLRMFAERLHYLRELNDRRLVILDSIREQGQLTPELQEQIRTADNKTRLEDLYLPYRPKRHTKAQMAKNAGLLPLALSLWQNPLLSPIEEASRFINLEAGIDQPEVALEGAKQILLEQFAEEPNIINELREYLWQNGLLKASAKKEAVGKKEAKNANKFANYFDYQEPIKKIPSHRILALLRGRREQILQLKLTLPDEYYSQRRLAEYFNINDQGRPADSWLLEVVHHSWKTKLFSKLELELFTRLREAADEQAIKVFARNLRDLLLAAPAGPKNTIGLDPGIRTGVKVAVIDGTGKLLDYTTLFPLPPHNEWHQSLSELAKLAVKYNAHLLSVGNGTGSRDTERLVHDMIKMYPDLKVEKVLVSEAGASVYSASEIGAKELPDVDVSFRGAASIARRLQDPLAELVKIEPKSIGVGQYQHDVNQNRLARSLEGVVQDCVNAVGVDVNAASISLLTYISGLNETLANNIVQYRNDHGPFLNREALKKVPRMGEKTFQQAAGFLRITTGDNPLDGSSVHPESYSLVEKMVADCKVSVRELIGNQSLLQSIKPADYVTEQYGLPTIVDIVRELGKPGRDPRPSFKTVSFREDVQDISQLQMGMILEGVVSNVTNFGAFVDIGVHQDGLVHISSMAEHFISDPHTLVKAGDLVTVKVIEVDQERRRIGLTMRLSQEKQAVQTKKNSPVASKSLPKKPANPKKKTPTKKIFNTSMADALAKLKARI